jgi:hypothetical protein
VVNAVSMLAEIDGLPVDPLQFSITLELGEARMQS